MNRRILILLVSGVLLLSGCGGTPKQEPNSGKIKIVTTTSMLTDLVENIGGDKVQVVGLMGPGVDPHLYQASAGDMNQLRTADIVVYHGFHLEGKLGAVFASLEEQKKQVITLEKGMDKEKLLSVSENNDLFDPHFWFDVSLWQDAAVYVGEELMAIDPNNAESYALNLESYLAELEALEGYIRGEIEKLSLNQRVLVTAHDAFGYFGTAYDFEVKALQGISTDAQAGTADVMLLAQEIAEREIQAIFVETSVAPRAIEALQAAVWAKGFQVKLGGELYSDSLGAHQSYVLTFKHNVDTIVWALSQEEEDS